MFSRIDNEWKTVLANHFGVSILASLPAAILWKETGLPSASFLRIAIAYNLDCVKDLMKFCLREVWRKAF